VIKIDNVFLMFPTMRCNLRCSYCHFGWHNDKDGGGYTWTGYGKEHRIEREARWYELTMFLNKYRPYKLEFSGGEPTLYPDFKRLVNSVPEDSLWAITSNAMFAADLLEDMDFHRCQGWTVSHHKDSPIFERNIHRLRNATSMAISIVVTFADVTSALQRAWRYKERGYQVNLLRELNPGVSWEGTKEWDLVAAHREYGFNVVESDIPPSFKFDRGYECFGGSHYMAIMPDGKVYRCYSHAMLGEPIGDIWDLETEPPPYQCWSECLGCALDHQMRIKKIEEPKNAECT